MLCGRHWPVLPRNLVSMRPIAIVMDAPPEPELRIGAGLDSRIGRAVACLVYMPAVHVLRPLNISGTSSNGRIPSAISWATLWERSRSAICCAIPSTGAPQHFQTLEVVCGCWPLSHDIIAAEDGF